MNIGAIFAAIFGAASEGVLWGIMVMGVYLTYRILDFADLTVDGSFALGGCVGAIMIAKGVNPILAIFIATLAGMASGWVTGMLNTKFKIPAILSGILTMIALYSINMRVLGGKSNLPLLGESTLMDMCIETFGVSQNGGKLIIGIVFAVIMIAILYWFFGTEQGSSIRATGSNEQMARALGINTDKTKIFGLMISNGLVGMSGALVAQGMGFGDVGMGNGTIVMGLASIIIGEVIFGAKFSFAYKLMSVVIGSVIYRCIIAIVLQLGLRSTDLKLFTAIIVALALAIPEIKKTLNSRNKKSMSKGVNQNA
ncbi:MAG: ABC transporter permease [Oscillospiraceae bacterium]